MYIALVRGSRLLKAVPMQHCNYYICIYLWCKHDAVRSQEVVDHAMLVEIRQGLQYLPGQLAQRLNTS